MIGFWIRVSYAFRCFFAILFSAEIPQDVARDLIKPSSAAAAAKSEPQTALKVASPAESPAAVQILALLQRDGRLVDFLQEDVSPYPDAQLGAAVRSIHAGCRQVLEQYLKLEPVMDSEEDQPVTVPVGFDPAAIKVVGNISGQPPLRGLLRHRGWRVTSTNLPSLPRTGTEVVAPAEVEIP